MSTVALSRPTPLCRRLEQMAPSVAASRVVQGLARHGFTIPQIVAMTGTTVDEVRGLQAGRKRFVEAGRDAHIRAAGERVRLDVLPAGAGASWTRAYARRKGWMPLAAWDPDTIGDPEALPNLGMPGGEVVDEVAVERALSGVRTALNEPERALAVRAGLARGWSVSAVAGLLGISVPYARSYAEHGVAPSKVRKRAGVA